MLIFIIKNLIIKGIITKSIIIREIFLIIELITPQVIVLNKLDYYK